MSLYVTLYLCDSHGLPVGPMEASSCVAGLRCHPLSAFIQSFVWLLPLSRNTSPQLVKWSPDGYLISLSFSVCSPFLSSHLLLFSLSLAQPAPSILTYNLNSLRPPSAMLHLHHLAFRPLLFSSLKWMLCPQGVVSREQRKEEGTYCGASGALSPTLPAEVWRYSVMHNRQAGIIPCSHS